MQLKLEMKEKRNPLENPTYSEERVDYEEKEEENLRERTGIFREKERKEAIEKETVLFG